MKIIFIVFLIITISFTATSQTPSYNKEQTINYINDLASKAIADKDWVVKYSISYNDLLVGQTGYAKEPRRYNLLNITELKLTNENISPETGLSVYQLTFVMIGSTLMHPIVSMIALEDDAKRLKKAFEHLIELVKKDGDPFGN